jgi:hypothetical protein
MTEADLAPIADLLPDDVEQDPGPASYDFGDQVEITGFDACLPLFGLPGR